MDNIDIVCFSLSRWHAPISSPAVSIARELARQHRVFFIEHPHSYKDRLSALFTSRQHSGAANQTAPKNLVVIAPPAVLPINFLPPGKMYDVLSRVNADILVRTLRKVLKEHKIERYVFINFFDPFFLRSIPSDIKPVKYVYQCMDDMSQVPYTRRHGLRLEEETIGKADCTLCTSRQLTRLKSALSPHVFFHPNGADVGLFNTALSGSLPRPADMPAAGTKIIGFMGSIEYRTDFRLLTMVARRHADKIVMLIGPVYGREYLQEGLNECPNVVFAGPRRLIELPAYLQYFDCAIIPYKKNVLTSSIYPLKINEYLAAGKPVVSTRFSEDIAAFGDTAYIADTDEDFVVAIDRAIKEDSPEKKQQRVNAAAKNSWSERVREFWSIISRS